MSTSEEALNAKARVLASVQYLLQDGSARTEAETSSAVGTIVDEGLLLATLPLYMESLRPMVKGVATAVASLPQPIWERALHALSAILAEQSVPWVARAFILKAMPDMLAKAPIDGDSSADAVFEARGSALAAALVPLVGAATEHLMQRTAQASLLALPEAAVVSAIRTMVGGLPATQATCAAVIASPSANDAAWKGFERALADNKDEAAAVSKEALLTTLKQHYKGFGSVVVERMCEDLKTRPRPVMMASVAEYHQSLVKPLLALCASSHGNSKHSRDSVQQSVSVSTICEALCDLWRCYQQAKSSSDVPASEEEELVALARGLVDLSMFASCVSGQGGALLHSVQLLHGTIASVSDVETLPLPLAECLLVACARLMRGEGGKNKDVDADSTVINGASVDAGKGEVSAVVVRRLRDIHEQVAEVASRVDLVLKGYKGTSAATDADASRMQHEQYKEQARVLQSISNISKKLFESVEQQQQQQDGVTKVVPSIPPYEGSWSVSQERKRPRAAADAHDGRPRQQGNNNNRRRGR